MLRGEAFQEIKAWVDERMERGELRPEDAVQLGLRAFDMGVDGSHRLAKLVEFANTPAGLSLINGADDPTDAGKRIVAFMRALREGDGESA